MNRVAAATVIRGSGECQVYINGIVSAEMKRQQEMMRAERERTRMVEASRDKLLCHNLENINHRMRRRRNPIRRMWERLVNAWAMGWAVLICWAEMAGLTGDANENVQH